MTRALTAAPREVVGLLRSHVRLEVSFLPPARAMLEDQPSFIGRLLMGVLSLTMLAAAGWSWFARVDIVATASGQVVPVARTKTIQPLETSVVRVIHVTEGQHVQRGDVLLELDTTSNAADRDRAMLLNMQARLDVARLRGLQAAESTGSPPQLIGLPRDAPAILRQQEQVRTAAQAAEQAAKIAELDQQIAEKGAEAEETVAQQHKTEQTLPLLAQESTMRHQLYDKALGGKVDVLEIDQRLIAARQDLVAEQEHRDQALLTQRSLIRQRQATQAQYDLQLQEDLAKAEQEQAQAGADVLKAADRAMLQTLRAPLSGTVQQLAVSTVGGVVTAAQPLMSIAPDDRRLEIEAMLPNKDAGFVHVGQTAAIKIKAFSYTKYGVIPGTILSVSRDAAGPDHQRVSSPDDHDREDSAAAKRGDDAPAYIVRISLGAAEFETEEGVRDLEPGMAVTADIRTGERRVLDYLLAPAKRAWHESFHER